MKLDCINMGLTKYKLKEGLIGGYNSKLEKGKQMEN